MRFSGTKLGSINQYRGFGNQLWDLGGSRPSLDLRFADNKSLTDATTGASLVTFTRASSGTFVGSNGVLQTAVTNLLLRSEEFDNASWTKVRASISANTITAPNGTLTADTGIEDTSSSTTHNPLIQDATIVANGTYTASLYVRAKERSRGAIWFSSTDSANYVSGEFNLNTGTIATVIAGTGSGALAAISNVGDGWFRVSITGSIGGSLTTGRLVLRMADASGSVVYTGDGTSGLFLWGAQIEQSATVGEYIPTTSTINSAPRFDHNPTTGESLGLLVEEARTNSVTNNTMVGAVAGTPGTNPTGWTFATAQSNGLTISIVGTGVENGINYIDYRFNGTTVASPNACAFGFVNAAAATGQTWTASMYWKLAAGSATGAANWQLGIIENTAVGTFVTGAFYTQTTPTSAALITQRPTATRTLSGGVTVGLVSHTMNITVAGNTAIDFTIRIGLPQLEQGAFATSPILTSTAAATRAADVASITGSAFSIWYRQDEGTFYSEGGFASAPFGGGNRFTGLFAINDTTANNFIGDGLRVLPGSSTRDFAPEIYVAGVQQFAQNSNIIAENTSARCAIAYKVNDCNAAFSIGPVNTTDTSATIPTATQMQFGVGRGGQVVNGHIKRLVFWKARLANTTLQTLTQ